MKEKGNDIKFQKSHQTNEIDHEVSSCDDDTFQNEYDIECEVNSDDCIELN